MTQYSSASPDSTQTDSGTDKCTDSLDFTKTKTEPCDSLLDFCKAKSDLEFSKNKSDFTKTKTEPCDSLLEFCKTKSDSCDQLDELAQLVSSQTDSYEFTKPKSTTVDFSKPTVDFSKPTTVDFSKFGTYRDKPKEFKNSPCKPKGVYDAVRGGRQVGFKYKRHDSPVSTLDEV